MIIPKNTNQNARSGIFVVLLAVACLIAGLSIGYQRGVTVQKNIGTSESLLVNKGEAAGFASGTVTGLNSKPAVTLNKDVDFSMFWQVWKDLKDSFYEQPVSDKELFYGALRGMAASLNDPYTNYFEPQDAKAFDESLKGEFSGIGAEIGTKDGQLQIVAPLPDSPAEKAGIKPRDLILQIDGKDAVDMPVDEAVTKIRGPKGTTVKLQLGRYVPAKDAKAKPEAKTIDVSIVRDTIVVKSVHVKPQSDGIFLIEILNFNDDVADSFKDAVDEVISKGAKGLVIDVRNDPGGYLDKAISVAGEWLKDEVVVEQRERGVITERYQGTGRGLLKGIPTVVLINEGSASASEILAGALQDYGIAAIVGMKSFGKGSVQDYREYPDGSAVKITIAEWLTPKGRSINKEGIIPDVEVKITPDDINAERDPQLEKAIELLKDGKAKPAAPASR
jgi:carboxyl-terminal processing protease